MKQEAMKRNGVIHKLLIPIVLLHFGCDSDVANLRSAPPYSDEQTGATTQAEDAQAAENDEVPAGDTDGLSLPTTSDPSPDDSAGSTPSITTQTPADGSMADSPTSTPEVQESDASSNSDADTDTDVVASSEEIDDGGKPSSQTGLANRPSSDDLAAWLTQDHVPRPPAPPESTNVIGPNLEFTHAFMPRCVENVCVDPLSSTTKFQSSICNQARGSMSIAMDFVGFIGEGEPWQGPYTDTVGRTYYAKYVNSKEGMAASTYLMQGVRLQMRQKEVGEGQPVKSPVRTIGLSGNRIVAMESLAKSLHLDYPFNPIFMGYVNLPFDSNSKTNIGWGGYALGSYRIDESPESPSPAKILERWPYFEPFNRHVFDRFRVIINGKVAFDSNDVKSTPNVKYNLDQHAIGWLPINFYKMNAQGKLENLAISFGAEDTVYIDLWVKLELSAKEPWEIYKPHFEHTFRVITQPTPIVAVDSQLTGYKTPLLTPYTVWERLNHAPSFNLRADFFLHKNADPNVTGFPVTPRFTPTVDTYELTFDRLGELKIPQNPLVLEEKMADGWELTKYQRGTMEAKGPKINDRDSLIQVIWNDNAPRITLSYSGRERLSHFSATYFPADNHQFARHHVVPTMWGDQVLDFGPSGTFDWHGTTTFEIAKINTSSRSTDTEKFQSHYPVPQAYDFANRIPPEFPRFITVKYLPKEFLKKDVR